jgi:hypothetical protein
MALITLADWTCSINECINPLVQPGIMKDFSRRLQYHTIPAAWIVAQKEMASFEPPLCLCSTDLSHFLNGDVSISHTLKLLKPFDNACPSGSSAYSLRTAGLRLINQLGTWSHVNQSLKFTPFKIADRLPNPQRLSAAVVANWNKVTLSLSQSNLNWFFHGSVDLLTPRLQRRDDAELYIQALALTCKFQPSPSTHNNTTWATDGSMIPASSSISDAKSVTAAATGPATLIL